MKNILAYVTLLSIILTSMAFGLPSNLSAQQNEFSNASGVKWKKDIRIRGLMKKYDPFYESKIYEIKTTIGDRKSIPSDSEFLRTEYIAENFWSILRDSLSIAIKNGELPIYSLRESQIPGQDGIYIKNQEITYDEISRTLSANLNSKFSEFAGNQTRYIYDLNTNSALLYDALQSNLQNIAAENNNAYLVQDLNMITLYELKFDIIYNETGFRIKPRAIYFSTAHWDAANMNNSPLFSAGSANVPVNEIDGEDFTGFSGGFSRGIGGFMIDLTDDRTYDYLVQNGVEYSGSSNTIPFYDLISLFHYDYKIYAENNNVLAQSGDSNELEQQLLDRYNEIIYTYLYGQPPTWWKKGTRGHFTNGMFDFDPSQYQQD